MTNLTKAAVHEAFIYSQSIYFLKYFIVEVFLFIQLIFILICDEYNIYRIQITKL